MMNQPKANPILMKNSKNLVFREDSSGPVSVQKLNGQVRVLVTLAAEMIQDYHISEMPWLKDFLPKDQTIIKVFKPYEELVKAISLVTELPFVVPHSKSNFHKGTPFEDIKEMTKEYIQDGEIKGWVKEFYEDSINRKIKGYLYLPEKLNNAKFLEDIINGKVIDVSIGFLCNFDEGGVFQGKEYLLTQRDIRLGHLAGLPGMTGKCPKGTCGINQDMTVTSPSDIPSIPSENHYVESLFSLPTLGPNLTSPPSVSRTLLDVPNLPRDASGINNPDTLSVPSLHQGKIIMAIDEKDALITELKKQNQELTDKVASVSADKMTQLTDKLKSEEIRANAAEKAVGQRDAQITALTQEVADAKARLKVFDDQEKVSLISILKTRGYTDADFETPMADVCIKVLRNYKKSSDKFADTLLKSQGIGKPTQDDSKTLTASKFPVNGVSQDALSKEPVK